MARDFNGTDQYLSVDAAGATTYPLTIMCWAWWDVGPTGTLISIGDKDTADHYDALQLNTASNILWAISAGTGGAASSDGTGMTGSTWHHAAGVFASDASRIAYVDGSAAVTDTFSVTPNARDRVAVAARADNSLGTRLDGRVAEVALWNIALSGAEIASIVAGASPISVQASALVGYWPLCGTADPEPDVDGNTGSLVLTGSPPFIAHPISNILCSVSPGDNPPIGFLGRGAGW